jgi:hypothetical protein
MIQGHWRPRLSDTEKIRDYAREKYVIPARRRNESRFSIRAGDIVRDLGLVGRTPAVCNALRGRKFWQANNLRLVDMSGPKSGQSTTVVCTYEFADPTSPAAHLDSWLRLRGALKDVFSELGGGEAYLRAERENFYAEKERQ